MRRFTRNSIYCLLTLVFVVVSYASNSPLRIQIEDRVKVAPGSITLDQIALLSGDSSLVDQVTGMNLGEAPAPGQLRWITRNYIRFKLGQAGLDASEYTLSMPERIGLIGAGIFLSSEQLGNFIAAELKKYVPSVWTDWRIDWNGSGGGWLPSGKVEMELEPGVKGICPGTNLFVIRILVDGKIERRISAAIRIIASARVPILTRDVPRHTLIDEEFISWEEREISGRELLTLSTNDLRARRRLRQGNVLKDGDLEPVPLVGKGARVTIEVYFGKTCVKVFGTADRDGWLGQTIPVENMTSKKTVLAVVTGPGRVEVK
jgi:flagella basal body P-ring formation protein FlgA